MRSLVFKLPFRLLLAEPDQGLIFQQLEVTSLGYLVDYSLPRYHDIPATLGSMLVGEDLSYLLNPIEGED